MQDVVYSIVPFSRPKFLENVIKNFNQQRYKNKKLIVVENGKAVGCCEKNGFKPDVLLKSDPHQSYARNEVINWVKSNGGGMCANFDDDDYYGPNYLSEIMENKNKADIIGKYDFFIRTTAGNFRLFEGFASNCYNNIIHGATLACMAEIMPEYKNTGKWGEDWDLINRMQESGKTTYTTSKYNFMIRRFPNSHTWSITDDQLVKTIYFGLGKDREKLKVKHFGPENSGTLDVVNNLVKEPSYELLELDSDYRPEDSPAYVDMMSNGMESFEDFIEKQRGSV